MTAMAPERETRTLRRTAQALSFCLPGLGHLYAGVRWRAFALNGAFLLLLSNSSTRLLVPFVAAYAAWEAARLPPDFAAARPWKSRWGLFAMAGGVGVFLWSVAVVGEIGPWRAVERTREALQRAMLACRRGETFDGPCIATFVDGWGRKLYASPADGSPRSSGRDGANGTMDDVGAAFARPLEAVPGAFDVASPR